MPPLLSIVLGAVVAAATALVLLVLVASAALLILLVLLALDVLLDRNGVDRRAGATRLWSQVRRPGPARPEDAPAAPATPGPAARIPFSARRPRTSSPAPVQAEAEAPAAEPAPTPAPEPTEQVPAEQAATPTVPRWATAPVPPADTTPPAEPLDAVTEVLAVEQPVTTPAPRARAVRAPRPTARRTPAAKPAPEPAAPAAAPPTAPVDRDTAIDRLFAPLMESDSTEPLPRARPARRPADDA